MFRTSGNLLPFTMISSKWRLFEVWFLTQTASVMWESTQATKLVATSKTKAKPTDRWLPEWIWISWLSERSDVDNGLRGGRARARIRTSIRAGHWGRARIRSRRWGWRRRGCRGRSGGRGGRRRWARIRRWRADVARIGVARLTEADMQVVVVADVVAGVAGADE